MDIRHQVSVEHLRLIQARDFSGFRAYYFLKLNPLRQPQFEKAVGSGRSFDLEVYGEIIASGYGEEVPEHVLSRMRREYGWRD